MPQNPNNLKIGVKIGDRTTPEYVNEIIGSVDFLEIYAKVGYDFSFLANVQKPIAIHVPHFASKVNFANPKRADANEVALSHAVKLADNFGATKIIFHPELKEDENCSLDVLDSFVKSHYDPRLYIENMPFSSEGFEHFASEPAEIRSLMQKLNTRFCLDFAHALEYLEWKGVDKELIHDYLALKPNHFHLTDTDLSQVMNADYNEEHLNFGEGNVDLAWCRDKLPQNAWVTLETPQNAKKQLEEITFLRS